MIYAKSQKDMQRVDIRWKMLRGHCAWIARKRTGQRSRAVEGELMMKHRQPMPRYYGKNIVQHAQKKFFQRKAMEANQEKRRDSPAEAVESGKKE